MSEPALMQIYDTWSRTKTRFVPQKLGQLSFYSCGPTVYHYAHIGNLRTYLFNDVLKRSFRYAGYQVKHVMNITDVGHLTSDSDSGEDKMEKGAAREHKSVWQVAEFYTDAFRRDLALLNILEPDVWCKATDHIAEQIQQIEAIAKAGYAYVIADGVYFDTSRQPEYGHLGRLRLEELKAGARIEVVEGKKNPTDFALWKFSPKHEKRQMEWDSPWGRGFPGWHIECSAMACKYLGDSFDLHTGGIDLIPVHHTNEIAQANAAGKPFAKYWMHGEFIVFSDGKKMSKSTGEFSTLASVIERGFSALDYRYLCLSTHYRKPLVFSWEALQTAQSALKSLQEKILAVRSSTSAASHGNEKYERAFLAAISDDINMPQALAVLWEVLADKQLSAQEKYSLALSFDQVFGLRLGAVGEEHIPQGILEMVQEREVHRREKRWKDADSVRATVLALGYEIRDTPEGPVVRPV